ncbi:glycosyltransferase family 2 protein [candidate division KSB1 bacterium]|nr:MAG: glycosyltransferase family 2 protein [candidate division KSB1 bacterium]
MNSQPKIGVLIPAYNVADKIGELLSKTTTYFPLISHVCVVDDGSDDGTDEIVKSNKGVFLIQHPKNRGKGAALRSGFSYFIRKGYDFILTMDGDGQHRPEDIPSFLQKINHEYFDLLIGQRELSLRLLPLDRYLSNKLSSVLISILSNFSVKDSQSGYRLISTKLLQRVTLSTCRYETESELLLKALRIGAKIDFVPIPTIYGKEKSHIHRLPDVIRFMRMVSKIVVTFYSYSIFFPLN